MRLTKNGFSAQIAFTMSAMIAIIAVMATRCKLSKLTITSFFAAKAKNKRVKIILLSYAKAVGMK